MLMLLQGREDASALAERAKERAEALQEDAATVVAKHRALEHELAEVTAAHATQKHQIEAMQAQRSARERQLGQADAHIDKVSALLKEKDADAERAHTTYQEQQGMLERQEQELLSMRAQYETHMKKVARVQAQMESQEHELERLRGVSRGREAALSDFDLDAAPVRTRISHHHRQNPLSGGAGGEGLEAGVSAMDAAAAAAYDDQVAFLRAELNRSMHREKALILDIQDREKKLENAEQYLGNMDKVVQTLSKYT